MAFILFLLNELSVFALDYAGYGAKSRYFSAFLLLFLNSLSEINIGEKKLYTFKDIYA